MFLARSSNHLLAPCLLDTLAPWPLDILAPSRSHISIDTCPILASWLQATQLNSTRLELCQTWLNSQLGSAWLNGQGVLEQNLSVLTDNKSVLTGLPDPPLSVRMDNLFNLKREGKKKYIFLHHDPITCIDASLHLRPTDLKPSRPPAILTDAPE